MARRRSRKRQRRRPAPTAATEGESSLATAERRPGEPSTPARRAAERRRRRAGLDPEARPRAPWDPFPLVELVVLVALVLLVAGFAIRGHRGTVMIALGLVLGSLAGLELSIREHFSGYRSHTALLAGAVAIAVIVGLSLLFPGSPVIVRLLLAVVAFGVAARFLVRSFQRRSGLSFKVR